MTFQLPQILIRNSFNILGLSSPSALKEIRKRAQQLIQLAKIGEPQEFDTDIGCVKEFRNESEIRSAVERLSGVQDRLKEIFFWFEDHSIESSRVISLISKGSYQEALDVLEKSEGANADWLDRKNLALSLMFHAFASSSLCSFCRSLELWKQIVESDAFWKFYGKHYLLHDELGTSPSLFEEFRDSVFELLSANAASFYHQTKNPKAIGACFSAFGKVGKMIDTEILQPLILKVKNVMEELGKMADLDPDAPSVRRILKKIHNFFFELEKFELSDYSPLTVLKNNIAEELRSISVAIYNKNEDTETARLFLDLGSKLATSEALLDKIEADKKQLSENKAWRSVSERFDGIKSLVENSKFEEAKGIYWQLDNNLAAEESESSADNRIHLLINYCSLVVDTGQKLVEKRNFGIKSLAISGLLNWKSQKNGIRALEHAWEVLRDRLCLLEYKEFFDGNELLKTLDGMSADLRACEQVSLFDRFQRALQTLENIAQKQADEKVQIVIKLLGCAACRSVLYQRIREISEWTMLKRAGQIALIIFITICRLAPGLSHNSSHSYQQTPVHSSSSEKMSPEEIEAIECLDIFRGDVLKKLRDKGYSDREIAQMILEDMKEKGCSDVMEYFIDMGEKTK